MNDQKLRIVPLGGLGEVGKNMMSIEYDGEIIIIDTGIMFPENDMLGIDYIIPDFQYLLNHREKVRAILVTHGHEDHTGAINHVLEQINAPIYATPLTRGLLEVKLARGHMLDKARLQTVRAGSEIRIGPFDIELFHVCHSIPDGVGLGINTPQGLIVHSGTTNLTIPLLIIGQRIMPSSANYPEEVSWRCWPTRPMPISPDGLLRNVSLTRLSTLRCAKPKGACW
jgi:ribonuclease J